MQNEITIDHCIALDKIDPIAHFKNQFALPNQVIYLNGNSLGPMPTSCIESINNLIQNEWGNGLVRSWNSANWFNLPERIGQKIGKLIGADHGEVIATDSTSINLYKVLHVALQYSQNSSSGKYKVLSEINNFPTDLYIIQSLCNQFGFQVELCESREIVQRLNENDIAVLVLSHVNYRNGAMHNMKELNKVAISKGTLTIWDLAHSAGAVPLNVYEDGADFAVGCGYKYFNGGPGAPAFIWAKPNRKIEPYWQPLSGWWGHVNPFAFRTDYVPAMGNKKYLCGTPPILSLVALDCGIDSIFNIENGSMQQLRHKSIEMGSLLIKLIDQKCAGFGIQIESPRSDALRGSHVSISFRNMVDNAEDLNIQITPNAYAVAQALASRNVICDFRAGDNTLQRGSSGYEDLIRFGIAPAYLTFTDIWNAVSCLQDILINGDWEQPKYQIKNIVT